MTVQIWEAATGNAILTYSGHSQWVNAVAFSPDGTKVASGSSDQKVQVWESDTGNLLLTYAGHGYNTVTCLCFSPDGQWIASGDSAGSVYIWDAEDKELESILADPSLSAITVTGDCTAGGGGSHSWCVCDTVCTCNTVCTCDTVGGGSSDDGHYWYPT
jgi:WD40 repeat protein